jgi:hypothetical protein
LDVIPPTATREIKTKMTREYKIFRLDAAGDIFGPSKVITCENDQEVINKVRQVIGAETMEIWEGARRVATIRPNEGKPRA